MENMATNGWRDRRSLTDGLFRKALLEEEEKAAEERFRAAKAAPPEKLVRRQREPSNYGWGDRLSVVDGLFEEGHRFSFLQAIRLLEDLYLDETRTAPAEGAHPEREIVRFRHAVRLDFPASDIESVVPPRRGKPAEMTVNVLGLAGVHGPLPPPVSELVVERSLRGDRAFRDFLDIFNHRLVSLLYRARKKYRPALDPHGPDRGRMATVLQAFLGLGTPKLLGRARAAALRLLRGRGGDRAVHRPVERHRAGRPDAHRHERPQSTDRTRRPRRRQDLG
jgi:hypothetical protein